MTSLKSWSIYQTIAGGLLDSLKGDMAPEVTMSNSYFVRKVNKVTDLIPDPDTNCQWLVSSSEGPCQDSETSCMIWPGQQTPHNIFSSRPGDFNANYINEVISRNLNLLGGKSF